MQRHATCPVSLGFVLADNYTEVLRDVDQRRIDVEAAGI